MQNRRQLSARNLGGRPTAEFRLACQSAVKDSKAITLAKRIVEGKEKDYYIVDKKLVAGPPRLATRQAAAEWLADRAFGKATVVIEVPDPTPDGELTGEDVRRRLLASVPVLIQTLPGNAQERAQLLNDLKAVENAMEE